MKAFVATADDRIVRLDDVDEPTANTDEAVIEVEAFSVNRGDYLALVGAYGRPFERGAVPGQDVAGRIVVSAADGSGPSVGERVVAHSSGGAWAERVAVGTDAMAKVPPQVSAEVAASLPLAGLTALRLVRTVGDLDGKRLLITGASGGVGHLVVQLAITAGAHVVAVSSKGEKLAEYGGHVVPTLDGLDDFDIIMESVGGETFSRVMEHLTPGGNLIWFGQASRQPIQLNFFDYLATTPFTLRHFAHWISDASDAADLAHLVERVAAGELESAVGRVDDWAETPAVLMDLIDRKIRGNAVLTIGVRHDN